MERNGSDKKIIKYEIESWLDVYEEDVADHEEAIPSDGSVQPTNDTGTIISNSMDVLYQSDLGSWENVTEQGLDIPVYEHYDVSQQTVQQPFNDTAYTHFPVVPFQQSEISSHNTLRSQIDEFFRHLHSTCMIEEDIEEFMSRPSMSFREGLESMDHILEHPEDYTVKQIKEAVIEKFASKLLSYHQRSLLELHRNLEKTHYCIEAWKNYSRAFDDHTLLDVSKQKRLWNDISVRLFPESLQKYIRTKHMDVTLLHAFIDERERLQFFEWHSGVDFVEEGGDQVMKRTKTVRSITTIGDVLCMPMKADLRNATLKRTMSMKLPEDNHMPSTSRSCYAAEKRRKETITHTGSESPLTNSSTENEDHILFLDLDNNKIKRMKVETKDIDWRTLIPNVKGLERPEKICGMIIFSERDDSNFVLWVSTKDNKIHSQPWNTNHIPKDKVQQLFASPHVRFEIKIPCHYECKTCKSWQKKKSDEEGSKDNIIQLEIYKDRAIIRSNNKTCIHKPTCGATYPDDRCSAHKPTSNKDKCQDLVEVFFELCLRRVLKQIEYGQLMGKPKFLLEKLKEACEEFYLQLLKIEKEFFVPGFAEDFRKRSKDCVKPGDVQSLGRTSRGLRKSAYWCDCLANILQKYYPKSNEQRKMKGTYTPEVQREAYRVSELINHTSNFKDKAETLNSRLTYEDFKTCQKKMGKGGKKDVPDEFVIREWYMEYVREDVSKPTAGKILKSMMKEDDST